MRVALAAHVACLALLLGLLGSARAATPQACPATEGRHSQALVDYLDRAGRLDHADEETSMLVDVLVNFDARLARCDLGLPQPTSRRGQYTHGKISLRLATLPDDDVEAERVCAASGEPQLCRELRQGCFSFGASLVCNATRLSTRLGSADSTYLMMVTGLTSVAAAQERAPEAPGAQAVPGAGPPLWWFKPQQKDVLEAAEKKHVGPFLPGSVAGLELRDAMRVSVIAQMIGHEMAHIEDAVCGCATRPPELDDDARTVEQAYESATCSKADPVEIMADIRGAQLAGLMIAAIDKIRLPAGDELSKRLKRDVQPAIRRLEEEPLLAIGHAIENAAELDLYFRLPKAVRAKALADEPEVESLLAVPLFLHDERIYQSLGRLGNSVLGEYWFDLFRKGFAVDSFEAEAGGKHMQPEYRTLLLVESLSLAHPSVSGGEAARASGAKPSPTVVDQIGVRALQGLAGKIARMRSLSRDPSCGEATGPDATQAIDESVAVGAAAIRTRVAALQERFAKVIAGLGFTQTSAASPGSACPEGQLRIGPECDQYPGLQTGPGCGCREWRAMFNGSVIIMGGLEAMSSRVLGGAAGAGSDPGAVGYVGGRLLFRPPDGTEYVATFDGSLGGSTRGVVGRLVASSMGGGRLLESKRGDDTALVLRAGFAGELTGTPLFWRSGLEVPSGQLFYHWERGASVVETGLRAGVLLTGHFDFENEKRGLGVTGPRGWPGLDAGWQTSVQSERILVDSLFGVDDLAFGRGPVTVARGRACWRLRLKGFLCGEDEIGRVSFGGTSLVSEYYGITLSIGDHELY